MDFSITYTDIIYDGNIFVNMKWINLLIPHCPPAFVRSPGRTDYGRASNLFFQLPMVFSFCIRSSIGGWVEKMLFIFFPLNGLAINKCAVAEEDFFIG